MNAERRKTLADLVERLSTIKSELETVAEAEREAFDNLPEGLQQGDNGLRMSDAADALDGVVTDLDTALDAINEAAE